MEFREFCNYIRENILDYFPEEFAKSEVTVDGTMKNNGVFRQGLTLRTPESNIAPKVYLEEFYHSYDMGTPLNDICMKIAVEYQKYMVKDIPFVLENVMDFEKMKPNITMKMVAAKTNKMLLKERPATRIDDLAVFYQIEIGGVADGRASIPVTNEILARWDVPLADIHQLAIENTERLFPSRLTSMEAAVFGVEENFLSGDEYSQSALPLLVLTNNELNGGACAIANPDILNRISEVVNDSFYILPSSVHEVILVPKEAARQVGMSTKELGVMVRQVNGHEVSREEQLSDHIYEYDKDRKVLETVKDSKEKTMDMER